MAFVKSSSDSIPSSDSEMTITLVTWLIAQQHWSLLHHMVTLLHALVQCKNIDTIFMIGLRSFMKSASLQIYSKLVVLPFVDYKFISFCKLLMLNKALFLVSILWSTLQGSSLYVWATGSLLRGAVCKQFPKASWAMSNTTIAKTYNSGILSTLHLYSKMTKVAIYIVYSNSWR